MVAVQDIELEWSEQAEIVRYCIKNRKSLCEVLIDRGLSYDDFKYYHKIQVGNDGGQYKSIENFSVHSNGIPVASFFSGCGGLDLGFEAAGFEHAVCIDNNELFCNTLRVNRPKWKVIGPPDSAGDVSDRNRLHKELKQYISSNFDGVFIGGPPCQPFSIAANQRFTKDDSNFKRVGFSHKTYGNLIFDFIWFIKKFKPKAFLIENVPGLAIDGGKKLGQALSVLSNIGYSVSGPRVLDAITYGVPQYRKRLFIIGSLRGTFIFPQPVGKKVPCYKALRLPSRAKNHITRKHTAESIKRYMMLGCGERDQLGRVDRLNPNLPSNTVIAGGTRGGGRSHLHPLIPRTLSVRECARLQTFPDSFVFGGSAARQFTQVGNAVPPVLAYHLASSLAQQAFS